MLSGRRWFIFFDCSTTCLNSHASTTGKSWNCSWISGSFGMRSTRSVKFLVKFESSRQFGLYRFFSNIDVSWVLPLFSFRFAVLNPCPWPIVSSTIFVRSPRVLPLRLFANLLSSVVSIFLLLSRYIWLTMEVRKVTEAPLAEFLLNFSFTLVSYWSRSLHHVLLPYLLLYRLCLPFMLIWTPWPGLLISLSPIMSQLTVSISVSRFNRCAWPDSVRALYILIIKC